MPSVHSFRLTLGVLYAAFLGCLSSTAHARIGVEFQMQTGNPSGASADPLNHTHYLIQRAQYAMDYNDLNREPNWVAWDLITSDVGSSGRSSFTVDSTLPEGFTRVDPSGYSNTGYDRGHMCPSGDRTVSVADNQFVFYMTNMIPQASDNNQGVWENFETECRTLASQGNELLILCGPSLFGGAKTPSGVAIPSYTWKIALVVPLGAGSGLSRITMATRVIALKIPNTAGVKSTPWRNFITNVAEIEYDTGLVFFSTLTPSLRSYLRLVVDGTPNHFPLILTNPVTQTVLAGSTVTLSVAADANGYPPLSYQWRKDGIPLDGATSATLLLPNAQAGDSGNYDVVITNPGGSVTSETATLTIDASTQQPEQPALAPACPERDDFRDCFWLPFREPAAPFISSHPVVSRIIVTTRSETPSLFTS